MDKITVKTTIIGVCFFCGKSREVVYSKERKGYYCTKCIDKTPDSVDVKIYEPIEKTGRRITHTHRGKILKIEDF